MTKAQTLRPRAGLRVVTSRRQPFSTDASSISQRAFEEHPQLDAFCPGPLSETIRPPIGRGDAYVTGRLKATLGPLKGSSFVLGQRTILGRAVDCDIQVLARGVSRQHAAIIVNDEGEPYLMDLASKN